ncbi:MAG: DsbA family protein, partial [Fibrobacterota bacterium]
NVQRLPLAVIRWPFSINRCVVLLTVLLHATIGFTQAKGSQAFLDSLHGSFYVSECCSSTLSECIKEKPDCSMAKRLVAFTSWMKDLSRSTDEMIAEALEDRYLTFTSDSTFAIDTAGWPVAGDEDAPVTITEYYAAGCPMCKVTYKELFHAVTDGPLKGKAKLLAKPLTTIIGDQALEAAHSLGRFTDFMLILERQRGRPTKKMMLDLADSLGVNRKKFEKLMESKAVKKRLQKSRREARGNGVKVTPTFFIQNRRYRSHKATLWMIDAAEYFYENGVQSGKGSQSGRE